jgi:murein DD-endopeptidase MepM/ murein hydrolase activator NlpD
VALFAVPQDLSRDAQPKVIAEDLTGNRREVSFWVSIKPRHFAERTLEIGKDFLDRKIPELLTNNSLPPTDDLLAGYLLVNRQLRDESEKKIREVCARSDPEMHWDGVFLRQPNAAPLSSFADRRTYTHEGKTIDHQTHLGFDLASLRLSEVPAASDARVAFAGNLGIYGETVILDHGLGLFSLYGHLSSINVQVDQRVKRGDTIGRTGETGLAGGDHLHFSVMIRGIHVDPVEWWDGHWIQDHVDMRLNEFPRATPPAPAPPPPAAAAAEKPT